MTELAIEGRGCPTEVDIAIIGGGINGCAIAREAAARGLRVALFEADDFGAGTTSRSTKLVHGGLRYLEQRDFRLVIEARREQAWLLETRPHLVVPLRFLFPLLPWTRRPAWQLRLGLSVYDAMTRRRRLPRHRRLIARHLKLIAPFLPAETKGGFAFFDARLRSPERLALELALEAERLGAFIANHAPVTGVLVEDGVVRGVEASVAGVPTVVTAPVVVNAAGPWVDAVNRIAGIEEPLLGVTRGTHIALELGGLLPRDAVFSTAKDDGRVFFAVPQEHLLLVGTTDERFDGDPGDVQPAAEEIAYLVREAQELLPGLGIHAEQVRFAYAGLRPLQRSPGGPEEAITRRHTVVEHAKRGGPAGVFSVLGGKLSTFRPLANDVLAATGLDRSASEFPEVAAAHDDGPPCDAALGPVSREHLLVYGPALPAILEGDLSVICPHTGAVAAEVAYVAANEHALTLTDILLRRTGIAWSACRGTCCDARAAAIAAPILGWSVDEADRQFAACRAEIARVLPAPAPVGDAAPVAISA
jgi:glycerol-3-phosphate dehydrogenase